MRALLALVLAGCSDPPSAPPADTGVLLDYPTGDTPYVTPPTACASEPIVVRGGMGATSFTPLEPGDVASIYHEPAGGWNLQTAIDVANSSGTIEVNTTVTLLETGQVISGLQGTSDANRVFKPLVPTGDCRGEAWAVRAFLNDFTPSERYDQGNATIEEICALDGQRARIAWTVTDLVGEPGVGETSVDVVLASDRFDAAYYCAALDDDTGAPAPR